MRLLVPAAALALLAHGAAAQESPTWAFLRDKYDADRNGAIAPEEYERGAERFAALDADGDGVLTARDFEGPGRGGRGAGPQGDEDADRARARRSAGNPGGGPDVGRGEGSGANAGAGPAADTRTLAALLFRSTQSAREQELSAATLREGFAALDADADGRWTRAEFEAGAGADPALPVRGLARGDDRFAALLAGLDADGDAHVALDEIDVLFAALDLDGDGTWTDGDRRAWRGDELPPPASPDGEVAAGSEPRHGSDPEAVPPTSADGGASPTEHSEGEPQPTRPAAARPPPGITPGASAPELVLAPLHGGEPVALSSFVGETPVALIFGSYT